MIFEHFAWLICPPILQFGQCPHPQSYPGVLSKQLQRDFIQSQQSMKRLSGMAKHTRAWEHRCLKVLRVPEIPQTLYLRPQASVAEKQERHASHRL